MKRSICIAASSVHVLTLAICTYIAAIEIKSILVTGWICSITGTVTGITAIKYDHRILAAAGYLTPIIAVVRDAVTGGP